MQLVGTLVPIDLHVGQLQLINYHRNTIFRRSAHRRRRLQTHVTRPPSTHPTPRHSGSHGSPQRFFRRPSQYVHRPRRQHAPEMRPASQTDHVMSPPEATREEMREAKLPLAYRDSCANLLIPLNRCRVDTYYLPWKCEVCPDPTCVVPPLPIRPPFIPMPYFLFLFLFFIYLTRTLPQPPGRAPQLREVPICRVQEARGQDGRVARLQGRCAE